MFEEMIEKIKSVKYDEDDAFYHGIDYAHRQMNKKIIQILEESIPKPQDKPDSEGWWWILTEGGEFLPAQKEGNKIWGFDTDGWYTLEEVFEIYPECKWIKAILPNNIES